MKEYDCFYMVVIQIDFINLHSLLYSICSGHTYYRPMISDMLLSTLKSNVGAASSIMNFGFTVTGSIGIDSWVPRNGTVILVV